MKNNFALCCLLVPALSAPIPLFAQCPTSVNAGEDIYVCSVPQQVQLNAETDYAALGVEWTKLTGTLLGTNLTLDINVVQTASYVFTAKSFDPTNNLIVNGDFEQGNTGFYSSLNYSPGDLYAWGNYDVLTNPQTANPSFAPCGDHTTGTGNMMATNSPPMLGHDLWCQTIAVTPNTDYYFSFWATSLLANQHAGTSLFINDISVATIVKIHPTCLWVNRTGIWNSGSATSATMCFDKSVIAPQFTALDDIFFTPVCKKSDTVSVYVVNVQALASPPVSAIDCEGANLTLNGTGSTTGWNITYNWDTPDGNIVSGQNTLNPVVNAGGTYTLTVSLDNGIGNCTKTTSVEVEVSNQPQANITSPPNLACGSNATLTGMSSQAAPSTYQWTASSGGNIVSGINTPVVTVNQPGTYTLLVTNLITGCTAEASASIGAPILPIANANASPITCAQQQAGLSGAGSSTGPSFTYAWSTPNGNIVTGPNSLFAVADTPGIYILQVNNSSNNCSKTDTAIVINEAAALPVNILTADTINCLHSNVILNTDSATYGTHHTYAWSAFAGGNIVNGADSLLPVVNAPGLYVLLVTDTLNACTGTDSIMVLADTNAVIAVANAPDLLTCVNISVTLNADGSSTGSSLTYSWGTSDGNIVGGADSPTPLVNAPGLYVLTVTNTLNACTGTDFAAVLTDNDDITAVANAPDLLTCANNSVTLNADGSSTDPSLTYSWGTSDGNIVSGANSPTPVVNAPGVYQLLLSNPTNGCTSTDMVEVFEDLESPDISLNVSGALNCHNASVNLTNTSASNPDFLEHLWTNPDGSTTNTGSNTTLNTNQPGNFVLLVSNTQNGCTNTATIAVVQHDEVLATLVTQQNATCFGVADGALGITASGGNGFYTYLWSNGTNTPTLENLAAGNYTLIVTDGENCTATIAASITQPDELFANASATPTSAVGTSDGTAAANPQGGIFPYIFAWNNGETTPTITGLPAGFYTVIVTDSNGCTDLQTVEVLDGPCSLVADFQATNPLCHGTADGQAAVTPSNGTAPFTYIWTNGSIVQTAAGLIAGTYGVTVVDANGCSFSGTVSLTEPPLLTLTTINVVNAICPNSTDGSATVLASGGMGVVGIEWDNGQSGPTASNLSAGTYTAVATDANGCTTVTTVAVQAIDLEPPLIQAGPTTIALGVTGSVTLTMQLFGALVTDNCAVAAVQISPETFNCFQLGEQQVTISSQDDSGNNSAQTVVVNFIDDMAPLLECPASITRCFDDNVVDYAAPVAFDNCLVLGGTFNLVAGLPSGLPFPEGTTTNVYTYTDASDNTGLCSFEVTILSPLVVGLDTLIHDINNQNIGGIQVTVGGSMPGYMYEWAKNDQPFASAEDLSGVGAGLYTLVATDAFGCKSEVVSFEVTSLVGTGNPSLADRIAVFPNPSSGLVYVVLPDEMLGSEIYLSALDATGRKVSEQQTSRQKRLTLDLSQFADGLYSILILTEQEYATWKIFVAR